MSSTLSRSIVKPILLAVALAGVDVAAAAEQPDANSRIELRRDDAAGTLTVLVDGREAFVYRYGAEVDLPHYYPVRSPDGKSMTVQQTDPYPHHRSFWFADKVQLAGKRPVTVYNAFYSKEDGPDGRPAFRDHVRHVEFVPGQSTKDQAEIGIKLVWEMDHTTPVLDELREMRVVALGDGEYFFDITFTVTAAYGDVAFVSDAVHYAWPYVRMNKDFNVEAGGTITNSQGGINQKGTNGKVARWIDYSNTVDGQPAGLAIFSHSDNPQPHAWLTRDYGCFGPRRIDARSGKPFTLKQGDSISRRVGILVHRGDVEDGNVAERYRQYVAGKL